jgi:hypothetical protein
MAPEQKVRSVIERGALKTPIVEQKTAWFDQIDLDAKAGGESQQRTRILRNVRFEQREAQAISRTRFSDAVS